MAVRIPTREVIPMAMIEAVRIVLSKFDLIDLIPSLIFSFKFIILNLIPLSLNFQSDLGFQMNYNHVNL